MRSKAVEEFNKKIEPGSKKRIPVICERDIIERFPTRNRDPITIHWIVIYESRKNIFRKRYRLNPGHNNENLELL